MNVFDFLLLQVKKIRRLSIFSLLLFASTFAVSRLSVYIGAEMVGVVAEELSKEGKLHQLLMLSAFLFFATLGGSFLMYLSHVCETIFFIKFQSNVMNNLSKQVLSQSISFFVREMSGNIISKFNKITNNIINGYYRLIAFIRIFSTFAITLAIIAFMNAYLALFYFLTSLVAISYTTKKRMAMISDSQKESELEGQAIGVLSDAINNAFSVKSFANVAHERLYIYSSFKKFLRFWNISANRRRKIAYQSNLLYDSLSFSFYLAVFYAWYVADLSVTHIVFIFSSINILTSSIKEFSYELTSLLRNFGELKDGIEFLYQDAEVKDIDGAKKIQVTEGKIKFDKISFAYDGKKNLFSGFTLNIRPKEKIGLVGKSGSGKSTLIKLISRYYDLTKGQILIDEQEVAKVTQKSLRKNISLIPQEPLLFNRSIMENIKYGFPKASDEQAISAAKKAFCHEFIMELPQGYDSKVGEKGVMLSGGERQRISIARAILQDAPILILDEATSALDSESEFYIQKALKDLMKRKTVIAVAHRLSTLKEMDRIVVMSKGKILEKGTQKELLKEKGVFYNFYKMQSEGFLKIDDET
ncbi:MAG: ABC transporter ATP-binding protein [Alphaproteobacteria bacterium]|nr:ABC transporter ATP-binding protein [Alphaproteobacteria bacterium]